MFVIPFTEFKVTPHESISIAIDDKVFELVGIVAPPPDADCEVWEHIPTPARASVSFVWTRYGFLYVKAAGLVPGTFLLCTAHLDKWQIAAARSMPPPLHVRVIELQQGKPMVLMFGELEKRAAGVYNNQVENVLLGSVDPQGLAASVPGTSFTGEFRITGKGLRLLRVLDTGGREVLPPRLSIYQQPDNSLDFARINPAADAKLKSSGIPAPVNIDEAQAGGVPFWLGDF